MTDLARRIAAHLDAALIDHERGTFRTPTVQRGLAVGGPFAPRIVLTVQEVAQLAARAAEEGPGGASGDRDPAGDGADPAAASGGVADEWAERLAGYRQGLIEQRDRLGEQVDRAEQRVAAVGPEHRAGIDALTARIPELGESATDLEYLAWRAAQADRDVALVQYEVALTEAAAAARDLSARQSELDLRVGQVDHLTGDEPFQVGGDEHLAILMIDLETANLEAFAAARTVELARQRLAHVTAMRDQVHAALHEPRAG